MTTPIGPATSNQPAPVPRLSGIAVALGAGVVLFLLVFVSIGAAMLHAELVNRRFLKLEHGMDAEHVISVMGTPSTVERCTGREALLDRNETPCAEQYLYRSPLGRWIVGINSSRKVAFLHQYVSE